MKRGQLMGVQEIAVYFDVRRETIYDWKRKPGLGFPEPRQRLVMGDVWDASRIKAWGERRK